MNRRDAENAEKIKVKDEKKPDFRGAARGPIFKQLVRLFCWFTPP
jgi:hypothetical protein